MPITGFDGIVLGITLFSAVLAMVRGFSREVFSLLSWAASAYAAYELRAYGVPYAKNFVADDTIAMIISVAAIFLVTLIAVSFITMRIADFIIDSRIGALDRTLGFIFGAARGILILVVAVQFFNEWVPDTTKQPAWVAGAKSKPFLDNLGIRLKAALPEDIAALLKKKVEEQMNGNDVAPAQGTPPADGTTAPAEDTAAPPQ